MVKLGWKKKAIDPEQMKDRLRLRSHGIGAF
jgi:hypothetical protein